MNINPLPMRLRPPIMMWRPRRRTDADPEAFWPWVPFVEGGEEDEWEQWLDWERYLTH